MNTAIELPAGQQLVLVSGAQRGIGESIAHSFAEAGHEVVVADLNAKRDGAAMQQDWGVSTPVHALIADVGDETKVAGLFDECVKRCGRAPTVLVNNAAVQFWKPFMELGLKEWELTLRVNLTGTFLMTQHFAKHRIEAGEGGVVINLGSGCNTLAFPHLVSYTASKGGVEMLTKVSALELGKFGIRVNCIAPGSIETARTKAETEGYAEQWAPLTPLGRIGTVDDVADAVVMLSQPAARFISGQTLHVDGGLFSRAVWPEEY